MSLVWDAEDAATDHVAALSGALQAARALGSQGDERVQTLLMEHQTACQTLTNAGFMSSDELIVVTDWHKQRHHALTRGDMEADVTDKQLGGDAFAEVGQETHVSDRELTGRLTPLEAAIYWADEAEITWSERDEFNSEAAWDRQLDRSVKMSQMWAEIAKMSFTPGYGELRIEELRKRVNDVINGNDNGSE